ncbi:Serine aminopeptidase, S33 [Plasmodiophora brassicae]
MSARPCAAASEIGTLKRIDAVAGRRLAVYEQAGADDAPLVVFVHGSCGTALQWASQIRQVHAAGYPTVAYDWFGCGRSDKPDAPDAYAPDALYGDLVALLRLYQRSSHPAVILVAHSVGGAFALRAAGELAGVRGTVVSGPVYHGAALPSIFHLPTWVLSLSQPLLTKAFVRKAFDPSNYERLAGLIAEEEARSNANPAYMFKSYYLRLPRWFADDRYHRAVRAVTTPVLVVNGRNDRVVDRRNTVDLLQALAGTQAAHHDVDDCGHQVMEEQPDQFSRHLLGFIRRVRL